MTMSLLGKFTFLMLSTLMLQSCINYKFNSSDEGEIDLTQKEINKEIYAVNGIHEIYISNIDSSRVPNVEGIESFSITKLSDHEVKIIKKYNDNGENLEDEVILDSSNFPELYNTYMNSLNGTYSWTINCGKHIAIPNFPRPSFSIGFKNSAGEYISIPDAVTKPYWDAVERSNGEWNCYIWEPSYSGDPRQLDELVALF